MEREYGITFASRMRTMALPGVGEGVGVCWMVGGEEVEGRMRARWVGGSEAMAGPGGDGRVCGSSDWEVSVGRLESWCSSN